MVLDDALAAASVAAVNFLGTVVVSAVAVLAGFASGVCSGVVGSLDAISVDVSGFGVVGLIHTGERT